MPSIEMIGEVEEIAYARQAACLDPRVEAPLVRLAEDNYGIMTMIRGGSMGVRKIAAGSFKVHCLAVMDEVQAKRETVVITKRGKPVAKLVPVEEQTDDLFGFLRGKVTVVGDVVSPALDLEEWGNLA